MKVRNIQIKEMSFDKRIVGLLTFPLSFFLKKIFKEWQNNKCYISKNHNKKDTSMSF